MVKKITDDLSDPEDGNLEEDIIKEIKKLEKDKRKKKKQEPKQPEEDIIEDNINIDDINIKTYIINSDGATETGNIENDEVKDFINKLINSQMNPKTAVQVPKQRQRQLDEEMVKSRLSEFLNSYIILGYDVNDKRVLIKHIKTESHEDAIIELLKVTLYKIMSNDPLS